MATEGKQSDASRQRPLAPAGAEDVLAETTAQRGEFVDGAETGAFVCTTDRIEYAADSGDSVEIAHDEITRARTFRDRSLTGFSLLGHLFLFIALLLSAASVRVFLAGTPVLSVVGLGTYLSTAFAYPTALVFYRMEVGEATVLRVETADGRFEFVSRYDDCGFERVAEHFE